eukprot:4698911-Pyramimonas_sp.AAC.1
MARRLISTFWWYIHRQFYESGKKRQAHIKVVKATMDHLRLRLEQAAGCSTVLIGLDLDSGSGLRADGLRKDEER